MILLICEIQTKKEGEFTETEQNGGPKGVGGGGNGEMIKIKVYKVSVIRWLSSEDLMSSNRVDLMCSHQKKQKSVWGDGF